MATPRKKPEDKLKIGRPSDYTPELGELICYRVATNTIGLKLICAKFKELPDETTISEWRWKHPEFRLKYREAKSQQAELLAEDCEDISQDLLYYTDSEGNKRVDSGYVASRKLVVDTRKWFASKLAPKFYGDKQMLDVVNQKSDDIKEGLKTVIDKLNADNKREY